jgi:hypothetical protein
MHLSDGRRLPSLLGELGVEPVEVERRQQPYTLRSDHGADRRLGVRAVGVDSFRAASEALERGQVRVDERIDRRAGRSGVAVLAGTCLRLKFSQSLRGHALAALDGSGDLSRLAVGVATDEGAQFPCSRCAFTHSAHAHPP